MGDKSRSIKYMKNKKYVIVELVTRWEKKDCVCAYTYTVFVYIK